MSCLTKAQATHLLAASGMPIDIPVANAMYLQPVISIHLVLLPSGPNTTPLQRRFANTIVILRTLTGTWKGT